LQKPQKKIGKLCTEARGLQVLGLESVQASMVAYLDQIQIERSWLKASV